MASSSSIRSSYRYLNLANNPTAPSTVITIMKTGIVPKTRSRPKPPRRNNPRTITASMPCPRLSSVLTRVVGRVIRDRSFIDPVFTATESGQRSDPLVNRL